MSTLKAISERSGISLSTASLILNGKQGHRFAPATRDRVMQVAAELGYQPQRTAQALARGKTHNIALLLNDLANPFFGLYASLIQQGLSEQGYAGVPLETGGEVTRKARWLELVPQRAMDGAIDLHGYVRSHGDAYQGFAREHPVVLRQIGDLDEPGADAEGGCSRVVVDYSEGTRELAAHLKSMGHRRIGFVVIREHLPASGDSAASSDASSPESDWTRMVTRAFHAVGLEIPPGYWRGVGNEQAYSTEWYFQAVDLLTTEPELTALVVHNTDAVPPVLRAAHDVGRVVGRDLAIASYDDLPTTRWLGPGITVVGEPTERIAPLLVELLLNRVSRLHASPVRFSVPTRLIVRGSTDPARRREVEEVDPQSMLSKRLSG